MREQVDGGVAIQPCLPAQAWGRSRTQAESLLRKGSAGRPRSTRRPIDVRRWWSDRQRGDCATGGVRADRVGAKLLSPDVGQFDVRYVSGGGGRRKRPIPWRENTRLTVSGSASYVVRSRVRAQAPASGPAERDEQTPERHLDTTNDAADGAPTPSGACSQPGASQVRRIEPVTGHR